MNPEQQKWAELFVANVNGIKKSFPWQEPMMKRLSALVFALEGREMDAPGVVAAHKTLKASVGVFSTLRGNLGVLIAAMASMTDDPAARLADTQEVYALLKAEKFRASDYLAAAAYEIASQADRADFSRVVRTAREIFLAMRANNRFLIGADDTVYAAMLALAGFDARHASEKVSTLYLRLKADFPFMTSRSCLLHLAQIMTLSERTEHCVGNLIHLNRVLRSHGLRLDRTMVLPSLGILSALTAEPNTLAQEITSAAEFLRAQKGFGRLTVTEGELNMCAVALIARSDLARAGASAAVTNMLIAQQTAMMVAMTSVMIASSTAAASSGY